MVEHNIYAASRMYTTITLASLAALVQMPEDACEEVVARMIVQKRLAPTCYLHQVEAAVYFDPEREPWEADEELEATPTRTDADEWQRRCRDRRIGAALAYLTEAHAMLRETEKPRGM